MPGQEIAKNTFLLNFEYGNGRVQETRKLSRGAIAVKDMPSSVGTETKARRGHGEPQ